MNATVIYNEMIGAGIWKIILKYDEMTELEVIPGQFINVYLNSKEMLLPRPLSICRSENNRLTLVYGTVGKGTSELTTYRAGTRIRTSMPLGNGFDPGASCGMLENASAAPSALLIGGGIGIPPMLELCYVLIKRGWIVDAALGFRDDPFLVEEFIKVGARVHVATDKGTAGFHGNVLSMIRYEGLSADSYFACGPKPMLKALVDYCASIEKDIQVSIEERMGCGYGACLGCTCKTKGRDGTPELKKVCKDGPVFWGKEVVFDE